MSYIILIGIILLMIILIVYMGIDILRQHWAQVKHIAECRRHYHDKDALAIDYWRTDDIFSLDGSSQWMDRTMRWVPRGTNIEQPYEDLYREGYYSAEKWMTELRYIGIPVFVRLHNFRIVDPRTMDPEVTGHERNQITTSTLYNVYKARTLKKAIGGFTKIKIADMDIRAMAFIIPLIVGILIGVIYIFTKGL